ncbi:multiple stress resistance protein BhsA [Serratia quinivorans]|uniref:multiple stress resistance protein BhsA n=1 Tax=Serratia quinivorans TaxID=137545 RepID=UPI00217815C9|nr:YdgH/BhsA/McbA-like domain containing protein [Serratia quinivorans]CAI0787808.1 Multiple stress resistance protein BhsA precursor [Serratia quinivorans]CAI0791572.1 Multiple stress resistance protein BhsA precursor [Serratia quinivorans]CAI0813898.1 Multiple stress resistance protein BhsA precursor [Serratia quinivorans]CAI1722802.1 Multiple stress resistance protein BhsA precursor [Serratia quinivorans]CAI2064940.1 Multiple stress resistance protein BhsA precursor [Serratia quinivorans]
MKSIKYFAAAAAIAMTSFATFAAEPVDLQQATSLTASGVVSAGHATTLSSLEAKLAAKAEAQGASSYRIISAGGNNMLSGTAVIYK